MKKKLLCTTLAALTLLSSAATYNKSTTGNFFNNSITAVAAYAETERIGDHDVLYKYAGPSLPDRKISYNSPNTKIYYFSDVIHEYKGNTEKVYRVTYYPKYTGNSNSIVDALNAVGVDSSKSNRKKIANRNYIENYNFTAEQNTRMLKLLKNGILIKSKTKI